MKQRILETIERAGGEQADRREFLKKASKAAAAVPAVALLLSAHITPAAASGRYGRGVRAHGPGHGHAYGHGKSRGAAHSRRDFGHSHKRNGR